jgi:hypothetical protein
MTDGGAVSILMYHACCSTAAGTAAAQRQLENSLILNFNLEWVSDWFASSGLAGNYPQSLSECRF